MWIRSQDKKNLIDMSGKHISIIKKEITSEEQGHCLFTRSWGFSIELGTYKTEERAIEVLGQIENQLTNISHTCYRDNTDTSWPKTEYQEVVFDMPAE